jgi:hypothetical protein
VIIFNQRGRITSAGSGLAGRRLLWYGAWARRSSAALDARDALMIDLKPSQYDDAQFVALGSHLLNSLIRLHSPEEVYVIQSTIGLIISGSTFQGRPLVLSVYGDRQ